jgi:hypothetical protein
MEGRREMVAMADRCPPYSQQLLLKCGCVRVGGEGIGTRGEDGDAGEQ